MSDAEEERVVTSGELAGGEERKRLADARRGEPWRQWGPYLAERAWGTVREDYSASATPWSEGFTREQASARAYRWSEDGMCGLCDDRQLLCLALSLWNGDEDNAVKERMFGLTNDEGRHGEDVKEHWWYLDATPTHSWMRWQYHYPQQAFPEAALKRNNEKDPAALKLPEFEVVETGIFDLGYWIVTVDIAKATPADLCLLIRVRNAGPEPATLHVLPTLWFRNTWSWGPELPDRAWEGGPPAPFEPEPLYAEAGGIVAEHPVLGRRVLHGDGVPDLLFCDNVSNRVELGWPGPNESDWPKDGIARYVRGGDQAKVNPRQTGTKAALHYQCAVPSGGHAEIRLRFRDADSEGNLGTGFDDVLRARREEADQFYESLSPVGTSPDEKMVLRQAIAGMLWSKQFYHYDVARWLDGDPDRPPPPEGRKSGRNSQWRHLRNADVVSMPDTWEYPWYAAWDLAFHAAVLAHVDPDFAKEQLALLCREGYQHPDGRLPAFEWDFGNVNPPVHAWAALRVFEIDGSQDFMFLELVLASLRRNFESWLQQQDSDGNDLFSGGFLGLDNIGLKIRTDPQPGRVVEQSDGTAWMAMYCLNLLEMCFRLSRRYPVYQDLAIEYFDHFLEIASAMNERPTAGEGMWDDESGFYYDLIREPGGPASQLKVRSMVGLVALWAVAYLKPATLAVMPRFAEHFRWRMAQHPAGGVVAHLQEPGEEGNLLFSVVDRSKLVRILRLVLDTGEFLSDHGVRSLSRAHSGEGAFHHALGDVAYAPADSETTDFGGNSNWRGPVWFPVNYLLIEALLRYHQYFGKGFTVEHPTGGPRRTLAEVAVDLSRRLVGLFLRDENGRRPVFGDVALFQDDPAWRDNLTFYEYFHGDTGEGLGASHQTGWTGLVADLVNTHGEGGPSRRFAPSRDARPS